MSGKLRIVIVLACVALSACEEPPKTPQQVFDRMTNAYARCSSYQDVGEFVMLSGGRRVGMTNRLPFSIQYRRPDLLRFEFTHRDMYSRKGHAQ
jgi:outer membrane lipoprotein-sorting protein